MKFLLIAMMAYLIGFAQQYHGSLSQVSDPNFGTNSLTFDWLRQGR